MKIYQNVQYKPISHTEDIGRQKRNAVYNEYATKSYPEETIEEHTMSSVTPVQPMTPEQLLQNASKKMAMVQSQNTVSIRATYKK